VKLSHIDAETLKKMLIQGTFELNKNKELVNALNVFPVPDGDTGTNMSLTMNTAIENLNKSKADTVENVAKAISKGSLMGARGNSGVILSQIFRGFAKGCKDKETLTSIDVCYAIKDASDTAYSAVLKPVEGTILTVIRKLADKAMEFVEEEVPFDELFSVLVKHGEITLNKTPEYLEVLKQAGVVDAGGKGLLLVLKGFYDVLIGNGVSELEMAEVQNVKSTKTVSAQSFMSTEDIVFTYCTEFIIETSADETLPLKNYIQTLGDSMVYVEDDDLIKVHVHTNSPGLALEKALEFGELKKIKIENMKDQHHHIVDIEEPVTEYDAKYGIIAVSMGDGFTEMFDGLGIKGIIRGGQTMNPSTEDFIKAIEECPSENIVLFPNNSNIIMAANQAKEISDKSVFVIPSKTMPQCISSMLSFDYDLDASTNVEAMTAALKNVKTIQITYAVRDTTFNELDIEENDYLAVSDGEIKGVGKDSERVVLEAIEKSITDESEILSIYYGGDVSEEEATKMSKLISERFSSLEIELYKGGQPLYYYILAIE